MVKCCSFQVVKGLRGGVQDVALKMLLGDTHYHVNSFRQVRFADTQSMQCCDEPIYPVDDYWSE